MKDVLTRLRCWFGLHDWQHFTLLGREGRGCAHCRVAQARETLDGVPLGPWRRVVRWE